MTNHTFDQVKIKFEEVIIQPYLRLQSNFLHLVSLFIDQYFTM